jgi:hypothetical protein
MAVSPTPTPATEKRSVRAATEGLAACEEAPDLYLVDNGTGNQYSVDMREPACTCGDFRFREARCKHIRRVQILRGELDIGPLREAGVELDGVLRRRLEERQ